MEFKEALAIHGRIMDLYALHRDSEAIKLSNQYPEMDWILRQGFKEDDLVSFRLVLGFGIFTTLAVLGGVVFVVYSLITR